MTNSSLTIPPQNSQQIITEGDLVRPAKATNTKPRAPLYLMAKDNAHPRSPSSGFQPPAPVSHVVGCSDHQPWAAQRQWVGDILMGIGCKHFSSLNADTNSRASLQAWVRCPCGLCQLPCPHWAPAPLQLHFPLGHSPPPPPLLTSLLAILHMAEALGHSFTEPRRTQPHASITCL